MKGRTEAHTIHAWILTEPQQPVIPVWGLSGVERLRRVLRAAGVPDAQIRSGPASAVVSQNETLLLLRSDYVFDERLTHALMLTTETALVTPRTHDKRKHVVAAHVTATHQAEALRFLCGKEVSQPQHHSSVLRFVAPTTLVSAYTSSLRKTTPPYLLPVRLDNRGEVERHIFQASYKGVTDLVTKWVWPLPARLVTGVLARAGIRPNVITLCSWILVVLAAWCFSKSWFGAGLAAAWLMTFLDTVDGKLARVTLTSSRLGHVLDHGLDLIHPPFWYLAWAAGLSVEAPWLAPAMVIILGGYVLGRAIEGLFMLAFGMEIHSWRPIDSFFRTITARRNPNLILLTVGTLISRPDIGLLLVAVWTLCSIGFHTMRLIQALGERWMGSAVQAWQELQGSLEERGQGSEALGGTSQESETLA